MKKTGVALLILLLAVSYKCFAAEDNIIFEDFGGCEIGKITNQSLNNLWYISEKTITGGAINIREDKDNRYCQMTVSYVKNDQNTSDNLMDSQNVTLQNKTLISLKVRNPAPSAGIAHIVLRDTVNTADKGTFILAQVKNGNIDFFPNFHAGSVPVTPDKWSSIIILIDNNTGKLTAYHNGSIAAEVTDYRTKYMDFRADSCRLRLQNSLAVYTEGAPMCCSQFDDVRLIPDITAVSDDIVLFSDLFVSDETAVVNKFYEGENILRVTMFSKNASTDLPKLIAVHKRNGAVNEIKPADFSETIPGIWTCELNLRISDFKLTDTLEFYILSDFNTLRPLSSKINYYSRADYITYESEIKNIFQKQILQHPYILADSADFDRLRSFYRSTNTDTHTKRLQSWINSVLSEADAIKAANINDSSSSYYIGYVLPDGVRLLGMSQKIVQYMLNLGAAYQITGEQSYCTRAYEILEKAGYCENAQIPEKFPDWHPAHYLDTSEMTAAFSLGYDWMYNGFTQAQRSNVEQSILLYGLKTAENGYNTDEFWTVSRNNWGVICNGSMLVGALAVADIFPETAFKIAANAKNAMNYSIHGFSEDGVWSEGMGYGSYALRYLSLADETLKNTLSSDYGLEEARGLNQAAAAFIGLEGPCGIHNFHDAAESKMNVPQMFWLADTFSQNAAAAWRLQKMLYNNYKPSVYDLLWCNETAEQADTAIPKDYVFEKASAFSFCSNPSDNAAFWMSGHGGKNNADHGHLDAGSFVFDWDAKRWAMDLGSDDYNLSGYFSSQRPTYYRIRAEGHNTLVINPDLSGGQRTDGAAVMEKSVTRDDAAFAVMNLTSCYTDQANSVRRGFYFGDNRSSLLIRDEIELKNENSSVYWFMHTKAAVQIIGDKIYLSQGMQTMQMEILAEGCDVSVSCGSAQPLITSPNPSGQNPNQGIRKIQLCVANGMNPKITVKIRPVGTGGDFAPISAIPLEQWS